MYPSHLNLLRVRVAVVFYSSCRHVTKITRPGCLLWVGRTAGLFTTVRQLTHCLPHGPRAIPTTCVVLTWLRERISCVSVAFCIISGVFDYSYRKIYPITNNGFFNWTNYWAWLQLQFPLWVLFRWKLY